MDTLGIIRQLRADPALADELRAALLSQDFLGLPERESKGEASWTAHQDDLDKATKRAPLLLARATALPVLAVVVSHDKPSSVVIEHARAAGVGLLVAGGAGVPHLGPNSEMVTSSLNTSLHACLIRGGFLPVALMKVTAGL